MPDPQELLAYVRHVVTEASPHMREIGVRVVSAEPGRLTFRLDYRPEFVGHPDTGVLHGGAVTVLLDSVSGLAAASALDRLVPLATLDLRIDYLRPATPGQAVLAQAHCFKVTRSIAFTRAFAYQDDPEDPIAHCTGSFMLATAGETLAAPALGGTR
jgi:uncharacterized protein (TIGR00369 family)